jgi:tricarballylate dehydrogenase
MTDSRQVIVVGGGNAALCAAISAAECGARVTLLERAPCDLRGGNSRFTAGAMRVVYENQQDLLRLMPELTPTELARADFGSYSAANFYDDLGRLTHYRTDPGLAEVLVEQSHATLCWMRDKGVRFLPLYGRQSFEVDGKVRFWGGLTVEAWGGGPGLVDKLIEIAGGHDVTIVYGTRVRELLLDRNRVAGVKTTSEHGEDSYSADAVILACGGFESSATWRARYLGPPWDLARVRGTRFNTGDGIEMAMNIGAAPRGHWSGCHAVAWDLNAPEYGDLTVGDSFQKHSYPLGILVNNLGERFLDEGADFRNFTYAKYGAEILLQPQQAAWQIFDAKVIPLLRNEYRIKQATRVRADSLSALAAKMDGVDDAALLKTIASYNESVTQEIKFDPTIKDGRHTKNLQIPKSNWANRLDTPPFEAYGVTCGITFTFGGLHVNNAAQVISQEGLAIPGLYAAGELVGGLFYFNYPGGTGLTAGAVFGKIAGVGASKS